MAEADRHNPHRPARRIRLRLDAVLRPMPVPRPSLVLCRPL